MSVSGPTGIRRTSRPWGAAVLLEIEDEFDFRRHGLARRLVTPRCKRAARLAFEISHRSRADDLCGTDTTIGFDRQARHHAPAADPVACCVGWKCRDRAMGHTEGRNHR